MKSNSNLDDSSYEMMKTMERLGFCHIKFAWDSDGLWGWHNVDPQQEEVRWYSQLDGLVKDH